MCKERNSRNAYIYHQNRYVKVDRCIGMMITMLNDIGVKTLASCCGHGIYPMSIIVKRQDGKAVDLCSGEIFKQKRKFYKKDKNGFYFIRYTLPLPPSPKGEGIRGENL
jgi:hypothetical protein